MTVALDDYRTWLDLRAAGGRLGSIALEAVPNRDVLRMAIIDDAGATLELELDYNDAGSLLDQLRGGMVTLLARHGDPVATAALVGMRAAAAAHPDDTPDPA